MALVTRISRLFKADMHAVLDRIEAPEILLKQAVREMGEAIATDREQLGLLSQERQRLEYLSSASNDSLGEIDEQLDLAFNSGDLALSRSVVRRKLTLLAEQRLLVKRKAALDGLLTELEQRLQVNQQRREALRQKSELLSREPITTPLRETCPLSESVISEQEVELELLREKKRRAIS
ncbi:MAG: PspA/IM30 family protein [Gammaproteobacteria bacterium]|nr:PspA/IM30 family protein [Gammaproteobacteria bacterium]